MSTQCEPMVLEKTQAYATRLLLEVLPGAFSFHNLAHTQSVVGAVVEISTHSGLDEKEVELIKIAAWLHDVGYCYSTSNHEQESIRLAREFLEAQNYPLEAIEIVVACIASTKVPQTPATLSEQILCDADLYHLGAKGYVSNSEQLRQETSLLIGKKNSKSEWRAENIELLKNHVFFTDYAREHLSFQQEKNLKKLRKKEKKIYKEEQKGRAIGDITQGNNHTSSGHQHTEELPKPARGIETMFRTTSTNHLQLSAIADNKANILITINSITLSLIVSLLIRRFEEYPNLVVPTAILTATCLLTIIFAVLATRPMITTGTFSREDILHKKTNLLFFGNFHRMKLEEYEWGLNEIMKDSDLLYSSLIHDIYYLGRVLGRKYRLLRICYSVFMYGLVISIISYIISLMFFRHR